MKRKIQNILLPVLCLAAGYFFYGCKRTEEDKQQDVVYYDTILPAKPKYDKDTLMYSELKACRRLILKWIK